MPQRNSLPLTNRPRRPNRYRPSKVQKMRRPRPAGANPMGTFVRAGKYLFSGVLVFLILGALSAGLIFGYHYLAHSEYLMVKKVVLLNINRVSRTQVQATAGLDKPTNILGLDLNVMAANLRDLAWVEDVTITRKLPDTVIIDITERRPTTLIHLGSLYYLDRNGTPFKKLDSKEKPELPIITGFSKEDFDQRVEFTKQDMKEVFALLDVLTVRNDRFRLENISEINFDPARGLSLFTREDNVQVKVGFGDYRAKMKRLGRVLAHLKIRGEGDGLVYFNLENSPRVVVRRPARG
jgi:cell division protein FtsQ